MVAEATCMLDDALMSVHNLQRHVHVHGKTARSSQAVFSRPRRTGQTVLAHRSWRRRVGLQLSAMPGR